MVFRLDRPGLPYLPPEVLDVRTGQPIPAELDRIGQITGRVQEVVVSNPVDVLTYLATKQLGLPPRH